MEFGGAAKAVDEDSFIRDFHRRVEGKMATEESQRAAKRLATLRQTIKQERRDLLTLYTALQNSAENVAPPLSRRAQHAAAPHSADGELNGVHRVRCSVAAS
jgi:hypothetical protein